VSRAFTRAYALVHACADVCARSRVSQWVCETKQAHEHQHIHAPTHTYQLEKDEALALASESVGEVDRYRSRLVESQVSDLLPICPPTHLAGSLVLCAWQRVLALALRGVFERAEMRIVETSIARRALLNRTRARA
jgi:hypothetical protein